MSQTIAEDSRLLDDNLRGLWLAAGREGTLVAILQALYDREINVGLQSFWDGGWTVWLGDELNGHRAETGFGRDEFDQIASWLYDTASKRYPGLLGSGL